MPSQSASARRKDARAALERLYTIPLEGLTGDEAIDVAFAPEFQTIFEDYEAPTETLSQETIQRIRAAVKRPKTPMWKRALGCCAGVGLSLVEALLTGNGPVYDRRGRRNNTWSSAF